MVNLKVTEPHTNLSGTLGSAVGGSAACNVIEQRR
jgi:hypothetical protein